MRYVDGEAHVDEADLSIPGGWLFGHRRSYATQTASPYNGPNGYNWFVSQLAYVASFGSLVAVIFDAKHIHWFTKSGTTYTPVFGWLGVTLVENSTNKTLTFTQTIGAQIEITVFNSFSALTAPGGLVSCVAPPVVGAVSGMQLTIYYGPWKCRQTWVDKCKTECGQRNQAFRGCIWLADFKIDVWAPEGQAGTRVAVYHCCCDCPELNPGELKKQRDKWENARDTVRREIAKRIGGWPTTNGKKWDGHHIDDLAHGGDPTDVNNILPVPQDVHKQLNRAYPDCYAGKGGWDGAGPDHPYQD